MDTEQVNEILRLLKIIADSSTANKRGRVPRP